MTDILRPCMGIDTASNRLHWTSSFGMGAAREQYGWTACKDTNPDVRRSVLTRYAFDMFTALPYGVHIFVEEPIALKNGKTTRLLGLAAGAIWAAFELANPDATWHWVDIATWKKNVVGHGGAKKEQIQDWVRESDIFGRWVNQGQSYQIVMEDFGNQLDLFDAFCLMSYGREVDLDKVG